MQQGDLIYIPQDVNLWSRDDSGAMSIIKTSKPITGVFLRKEACNFLRIYTKGIETTVKSASVYPMVSAC